MPISLAMWAPGRPAAMRWHSSSLPAGARRALAWVARDLRVVGSRQTAPTSPGGPSSCQQPSWSVQLAGPGLRNTPLYGSAEVS
jgi:hypothetical protein